MNKREPAMKAAIASVNENILNIITPSGMEFSKNYANVGENVGKIYTISRYPSKVDYQWLSELCNLEGTCTCIEFQPIETDNLIASYDSKIKNLRQDLANKKTESEKQAIEEAIEDVKAMIKRMKDEPFGYVNIMLFVQDVNDRRLESRIRKINSAVATTGATVRILSFRQKQAYKAISPYGIPEPVVANIGNRNMPISSFLGGFPMSSTGINDGTRIYLGKSKNGRLIILDIWRRGNDRTNSNWWIQGLPGVGKSSFVKLLLLMEWGLGTKVIIMDPEREYIDMARRIGGDVIDCLGGKNGKINPLQVRKSPTLDDDDEDKAEEKLYKNMGHGMNDLALHIQNLRMFFKLYKKSSINETQMSYLEKAFIDLYEDFGITWDTDIETLQNTDYPLFKDLYNHIKSESVNRNLSERQRSIYEELTELLYSMGKGADSFIWDDYTSIDPKSNFIVLDTSGLIEADEGVKDAQFFNLCGWQWQQVAADREEEILVGVDEGYTNVDPDLPYTIKFMRNMSKRIRKYMGGFLFITHSVVDVLDPKVKRYGQAIIDNACYKMLMGGDGKNLEETVKLFNLTEKEKDVLASKQRGEGILYAGSSRVHATIDIKPEYLEIMGRGGGK